MKKVFHWLARVIGNAITIVLIIVLLPYAAQIAAKYLPDESGAAIKASTVLSSKLEKSARLETMIALDTGVIHYDIQAALLGTVAEINISYEYAASFGIDLSQVQMRVKAQEITFLLPDVVVLQDNLTPTESYREDFWYPGFSDDDYQRLIQNERLARRAAYLTGEMEQTLWDTTVSVFEDTVAEWLKGVNTNLTFKYERLSDTNNAY